MKNIELHRFPITLYELNYLRSLNNGHSSVLFQSVDEYREHLIPWFPGVEHTHKASKNCSKAYSGCNTAIAAQ